MTAAEHLEAAERAVVLAEQYISDQKYDRVAAFAALATAHAAIVQAKGASK